MRAILIDPEQQSISEIIDFAGDVSAVQNVIHCEDFITNGMLDGNFETGFDTVYLGCSRCRGDHVRWRIDGLNRLHAGPGLFFASLPDHGRRCQDRAG